MLVIGDWILAEVLQGLAATGIFNRLSGCSLRSKLSNWAGNHHGYELPAYSAASKIPNSRFLRTLSQGKQRPFMAT